MSPGAGALPVVVAPAWNARRWDGTPEGEVYKDKEGVEHDVKAHPVMTLEEALNTAHRGDAMMSTLVLPDAFRMPLLKGAGPKTLDVKTSLLVYDLDPPPGVAGESFKASTAELVEDLVFDYDLGYWETMRGFRLLVWLDTPIGVNEWARVWHGYNDQLKQWGFAVDQSAKDITRVMRLPNVTRGDSKHKGVITGSWELPSRALPLIFLDPPKRVGGKGGLAPLAKKKLYAGVDRNTGLFRLAASFQRIGLSVEAMGAALLQVDLDICVPPIQTDPSCAGKGEVLAIIGKVAQYPLGDLADLLGDRPGNDMALDLGSQSEIGDWVLTQLENGSLGVRVVWDEGILRHYETDKGIWVEVDRGWIGRLVMDLDGCWVGEGKGKRRLKVSAGTVSGVWDLIQDKRSKPGYFSNVVPGVLVGNIRYLKEGEGVASPDYRDTFRLTPTKGPSGGKTWAEFLDWFSCGDQSFVDLLAEWVGATLFGVATNYEKALMLHGPGANGKSVFLKVIRGLFPSSMVCSVDPNRLEEDYWRAQLRGKVLNVVTELGGQRRGSNGTEMFKAVVSGDTVGAREVRGKVFDLFSRAGHIMAINELFGVSDFSPGYWRRWLCLPCDAVVPQGAVIRALELELLRDPSAIVDWAVAGVRRLMSVGSFTHCQRGHDLVGSWRKDADQVAEFLEVLGEQGVGSGTLVELYDKYIVWSVSEGSGKLRRKTFKKRLETIVGNPSRPGNVRLYSIPKPTSDGK